MISLICGSDGHLTTLGDTSSNSVPPTVFTKMSVVILTASLIDLLRYTVYYRNAE